MRLGLSADELLSTTRAVRKRLDFDRQVEPEVIKECLELAVQSPTGSNRQGWRWLVVTDPDQRAALGELYKRGWDVYASSPAAPEVGFGQDPERLAQQHRVRSSATYLAENFGRVPVMVIPILPGRLERLPPAQIAGAFGSILPGAWSFMLAARERGLGTAWTTIHLMHEEEAAEVLGIDHDAFTQCALITCGYARGTDFEPARRPPIETVVHWDRWGGSPPWT